MRKLSRMDFPWFAFVVAMITRRHCDPFVSMVAAMPIFRDLIPNGRRVPNPNIPGSIWAGVGHFAVGGGGARNPFGEDFATAGFQWTVDLCEKDSDGDGRSNGQELGDPNCIWQEGEDPELEARSHPGIPDDVINVNGPSASDTCANYNPFSEDVETLDIKFTSPNSLDGRRTQYVCEQYEVNSPRRWTSQYHQIKTEPLVDNDDILHHMWIYLCDDGTDSSDGNKVGQGSYDCNGIEANCHIVAGWALGGSDWCEPEHVGAAVSFDVWSDKATFKVEAHYDNSLGLLMSDQSGMRLHLTTQLRPIDSGVVILGMDYWDRQFQLPQGRQNVAKRNICPTEATLQLPEPVYVYSWTPHMHLYGKGLVTEHYRCGEKIGEIGNIAQYEFDNQQSYILDPPVKILPGDALVTTCYYDTTNAPGPILGGEQTTEEMCDNYLTYYPNVWNYAAPNLFTACVSYKRGIRPEHVGYNDYSSFVTLDANGDTTISNFDSIPTRNIAPCCLQGGAANCESMYNSNTGDPCGADSDCRGALTCGGGICG